MLQNAYPLSKIGFDTAENEPASKQLQKLRFEHIDMEPAIQGSYYGDDDEDLTLGDAY